MTARPRSLTATMARNLVSWLAVAVLVIVVAVLGGWRPRVEYIVALGALAAVATVAMRRLGATTVEAMWPSPFPPQPLEPGVDQRVPALETLLRRSTEDHSTFERRLRPLLEELAAHRLRRAHGVELTTQPDEARRLLGDEAWALVTEPAVGDVRASRIERAVAAIEKL